MFKLSSGNFDKLLDKATSHLNMEPDWTSFLQICDLIRQNDVQPKYALTALKKKLNAPNPHSALFALLLLESMVKNCGTGLHEELTSRAFCDTLHELAKTPHENVRSKLLELIQVWTFAFRKNPKHGALKDTMNQMKSEGYKFPALRESDAMFSTDTAPEWADGDMCHRCRVAFNLMVRKHHCRACGQVFCSQCSQKTTTLPKFGIEKEVRVCDGCYDQVNKRNYPNRDDSDKQESELPPEYVNSSLAQQNQAPPRKSEDELREEEELQLALALSQSEAEAKEKAKMKSSVAVPQATYKAPEPRPVPVERTPSPIDEQNNPELARYLNRQYWESVNQSETTTESTHPTSPSAPATTLAPSSSETKYKLKENGVTEDTDLEEFIRTLKTQVEIFVNRMKSNSSRGRPINNDSSVQTLFLNITAMHSRLLRYIQQHDDSRLHYERLQDKLTQVKDARAALDALRDEHRERLRREAEEAERQRQLQMAHKLEIMRKKKQEYLQYQRQLALQRVQEQEREMQMRQEQLKQQYLMGGPQYPPATAYMGSPAHGHGQQFPPQSVPGAQGYQYGAAMVPPMMGGQPPQSGPQVGQPATGLQQGAHPSQSAPQGIGHPGQVGLQGFPQGPVGQPLPQQKSNTAAGPQPQQGQPGISQQMGQPYAQQQMMNPAKQQQPQGMPQQAMNMAQSARLPSQSSGIPQPGQPLQLQNPGMPNQNAAMPGQNVGIPGQNVGMSAQNPGIPSQAPAMLPPNQQFQQPGAPPASPQVQQQQTNGDTNVGELISFD